MKGYNLRWYSTGCTSFYVGVCGYGWLCVCGRLLVCRCLCIWSFACGLDSGDWCYCFDGTLFVLLCLFIYNFFGNANLKVFFKNSTAGLSLYVEDIKSPRSTSWSFITFHYGSFPVPLLYVISFSPSKCRDPPVENHCYTPISANIIYAITVLFTLICWVRPGLMTLNSTPSASRSLTSRQQHKIHF